MSTPRFTASIFLMASMISCASNQEMRAAPSLYSLVERFSMADERAIEYAMTTLEYDGVIVPDEVGRSRALQDASLRDINGIPGREIWFRVDEQPCYKASSLFKSFDRWDKSENNIYRTSNDRYTVQMRTSAPQNCVTLLRFFKE